jgi:hypothetical protein
MSLRQRLQLVRFALSDHGNYVRLSEVLSQIQYEADAGLVIPSPRPVRYVGRRRAAR